MGSSRQREAPLMKGDEVVNRTQGMLAALALFLGSAGEAPAGYIYTTLNAFGSTTGTQAQGINDSGQIVGFYNGGTVGFLLSGNRYTALSVPGGGALLYGINATGQIVEDHYLLSGNVWTRLNLLGGEARGINDTGQIAGETADGQGLLLSGNQLFVFNVPGSSFTSGWGINNSGEIVGITDGIKGNDGFLLSGNTYTRIDVPGATYTDVFGINNRGQIVGAYGTGNITYGFVLTGNSLTTLYVPGSSVTVANGINDKGQIVGTYVDAQGDHGFLATPGGSTVPEPASLTLLGIGIATLAGYRWRRWVVAPELRGS
jgi:uncharacterized membrane protein